LFTRSYVKSVSVILAALVTVIVYLPALKGGFVFDDYGEIVDNPSIKKSFLDAVSKRPFRAIPAATYRLDYLIGGISPGSYHVSNLIFHLLAGLALAVFWQKAMFWADFGSERVTWWTGAAVGIAFLLHPMNVETVSYVSSRGDLIAAALVFFGLWCTFKTFENGLNARWYATGLVALGASLFCKETAIVGPILAIGAYIQVAGRKEADVADGVSKIGNLRKQIVLGVPYLAILFIWSIFRFSHKLEWGTTSWSTGETRVWSTPLWALGTYTRLALWPAGMGVDHGATPGSAHMTWCFYLGVGVVFLGIIGLYFFRSAASRPAALSILALLWWLASLSVVIAPPLADPVAERRAYLAMGALTALPVLAIGYLSKHRISKATAVISMCLMISLWGACSAFYSAKWSTPVMLWTHAVKWMPDSARSWNGLGRVLLDAGKLRSAHRALEMAVKIKPTFSKPMLNLGVIAMGKGDFDAAADNFEKILKKNPADWRTRINVAVIEERKGNYRAAEEHLRRALLINPEHHSGWFNLGNVLRATKKLEEAGRAYRKALALNPDHLGARTNLALALEDSGDFVAARIELSRVLTRNPEFEAALFAMARVQYLLGDVDASIEYLRRYLRIKEGDPAAWRILADMLRQKGRVVEAREAIAKAEALSPSGVTGSKSNGEDSDEEER